MEKNILKLNLKKDIFNKVVNGEICYIDFETSPFYFSKFTNNKHNTVEDVRNDDKLYKRFDSVVFACSGETFECNAPLINIYDSLELNQPPVFSLAFENPNFKHRDPEGETGIQGEMYDIEYKEDDIAHVSNEPIEEIEETKEEPIIETCEEVVENTEENTEVEDTTMVSETENETCDDETCTTGVLSGVYVEEMLTKFESHSNVYTVSSPVVKVSYMGSIKGCNKKLPINNEHDFILNLKSRIISYSNGDDLDNQLTELINDGYVFFCEKESYLLENNQYKLCVLVVDKFDMVKRINQSR